MTAASLGIRNSSNTCDPLATDLRAHTFFSAICIAAAIAFYLKK
jgi:hypothetical protein